jgi:hypothetical protein
MRKLDAHSESAVCVEMERLRKSWLPNVAIDLAKRTTGAWDEAIDSYLKGQKPQKDTQENE